MTAFLGSAPSRPFSLERFFRWRCYWDYSGGLATDLFVHLLTTIHFLLDAGMPSRVVASGQNYRFKETHEVPDTLNADPRVPRGLHRRAGLHVQQRGGRRLRGAGHRGLARLRDDKVELRPEHPVEGNGWVVESWSEELEKAYYADPKNVAAERPGQWSPRLESRGETYSEVGEDATKVHLARFFESVRTRQAAGRRRRAGPPRRGRRPSRERVGAQGGRPVRLGRLRQGRSRRAEPGAKDRGGSKKSGPRRAKRE